MTTREEPFPPALEHGDLNEVFPDIFFLTGAMETVLQGMDWQFSRNMTVVREGDRLVIINSVRLSESGLAELDKLGCVTDVIRLGALHGRDDEFYVDRYQAEYWALPNMELDSGFKANHMLSPRNALPISNARLFEFESTKLAEGIIHLERDGGIVIACDALQNWVAPDEFFSDQCSEMMQEMGFFTPANVGPVWAQAAQPDATDFRRLMELDFKHALCGHGEPLRDSAQARFAATFNRMFGI